MSDVITKNLGGDKSKSQRAYEYAKTTEKRIQEDIDELDYRKTVMVEMLGLYTEFIHILEKVEGVELIVDEEEEKLDLIDLIKEENKGKREEEAWEDDSQEKYEEEESVADYTLEELKKKSEEDKNGV